jgi:peptidoglycan/LPS O-acetylase OafA/YrhL
VERERAAPYWPALDGVRGVAVIAVLLFHAGYLRGGFLGVDAFFVLSGFLITSLLLHERERSGRVSLRRFWARRARRLLPALALVLLAVAAYAAFLATRAELDRIRGDALATMAYVANWHAIATNHDYFAAASSPLEHTWSLAIEEQFYVVFPIVAFFLVRSHASAAVARRRVFVVCLAGIIASLAAMLALADPNDPSRAYFGTDTRAASILVGCALAALLANRRALSPRTSAVVRGVAIVAVVLLTAAWVHATGSSGWLYHGGLLVCALATAAVITAAVLVPDSLVTRALRMPWLRAVGVVSYGLYLWHWPVYYVLDEQRTGWSQAALLVPRLLLTAALAMASYAFVERPVRRHARFTWAERGGFAAAAITVLVVVIVATRGALPTPAAAAVRPDTVRAGRANLPRVLVVGSSVAMFAGREGFEQLATTPRMDVLDLGWPGCRTLQASSGARYPGQEANVESRQVCDSNWSTAIRQFRPTAVFWPFVDTTSVSYHIGTKWLQPCDAAYARVFEAQVRRDLAVLQSQGASVVMTTAPYDNVIFETDTWFRYDDCQNALIRRIARSTPKTVLADEFAWLCDAHRHTCVDKLDGEQLRPDGVHFRGPSAQLFARWLISEAQQQGVLQAVRIDQAAP